jgi:hypothetical protein
MIYYVTISTIFESVTTRRFADEKGQCHREEGPAIETNDGDKFYYLEDKYIRSSLYSNSTFSHIDDGV